MIELCPHCAKLVEATHSLRLSRCTECDGEWANAEQMQTALDWHNYGEALAEIERTKGK